MKSHNNWPKPNYQDMCEFYGPVGANQTKIYLPYALRLSWSLDSYVNKIRVHKKVAESMLTVLDNVLSIYGRQDIKALGLDCWGGCLNVRKKRGGNTYSIHSWGAANDWLPSHNGLKTPWDQCQFSQPAYVPFLNAWIVEGWNPLGLSWGKDAMHIEATDNDVQPLHAMEIPDDYIAQCRIDF